MISQVLCFTLILHKLKISGKEIPAGINKGLGCRKLSLDRTQHEEE